MSDNKITLKKTLQSIKANEYKIPAETNVHELVLNMMSNIGNTDPVLRDDLIYTIFAFWIMRTETIDEYIPEIVNLLIDENHLFYKIGESGTDSIFTRSFSALLLPPIIIAHRKTNIFSKDVVMKIYDRLTKYYSQEKDLRGYVQDKGWAHAVAHGADALDDIALCSEIDKEQLLHILEIIKTKFCIDSYVYINQEDERAVTAINGIFSRGLLKQVDFFNWIRSFSTIEKTDSYLDNSYLKTNVKNLLRSLYFRNLEDDTKKDIVSEIEKTLKLLNKHIP